MNQRRRRWHTPTQAPYARLLAPRHKICSFLADAASLWSHSRCQRHTQMIAPTNRPSSHPLYFGPLVWADSVAQRTWSTRVRAAEVEPGDDVTASLLRHKMVIKEFTGLIANYKYGRPLPCSTVLRVFQQTRPLRQVKLHGEGSSLDAGLCVAAAAPRETMM